MKEIMLCHECQTDISDSAKFCPKCGAKVRPAIVSAAATKRCPVCGTANTVGAKFCKNDGVRLDEEVSPAAPIGVSALSAAIPTPDAVPQKSIWKWAMVVVMVLVLALGGTGAYLYSTGWFISSAELKANISSALIARGIAGIVVDVADDRVADLSGSVDDDASKDAILAIAKSVKGITEVRASLTVLPSIVDTEGHVLQALKDQQLIDVVVRIDEKRDATLTGSVSGAAMVQIATDVASATPGVKSVTNQVQVAEIPEVIGNVQPDPRAETGPLPRTLHQLVPLPYMQRGTAYGRSPESNSVTPPVTPIERRRASCSGIGGFYRLSCMIEGPETYFRCAPDGKNWNHAIPGCDRRRQE